MLYKLASLALASSFLTSIVDGHGFLTSPRSRNWLAYDDVEKCSGSGCPRPEYCHHCLNGNDGVCGKTGGGNSYETNAWVDRNGQLMPWVSEATYEAGQLIIVNSEMSTHHGGHMIITYCVIGETTDCSSPDDFPEANRLEFVQDLTEGGVEMPKDPLHPDRGYYSQWGSQTKFSFVYKLPDDVEGEKVLLQWRYITANACLPPDYPTYFNTNSQIPRSYWKGENMAECQEPYPNDGSRSSVHPEQFFNCAEVTIRTSGTVPTKAPVTGGPPSCLREYDDCVFGVSTCCEGFKCTKVNEMGGSKCLDICKVSNPPSPTNPPNPPTYNPPTPKPTSPTGGPPSPTPPTSEPGNGCCSRDLGTCTHLGDPFCNADKEKCEGPCGKVWLTNGDISATCLPLWEKGCVTDDDCCLWGHCAADGSCAHDGTWKPPTGFTNSPTLKPTSKVTPLPTSSVTAEPTNQPSKKPTNNPTTEQPTYMPSYTPTSDSSDEATSLRTLVCGVPNKCSTGNEDTVEKSTVQAVRCCRDLDTNSSGSGNWPFKCRSDAQATYSSSSGPWGQSFMDIIPDNLVGSLNGNCVETDFDGAVKTCAANSARLCTPQEMNDRCTRGTGCNFNNVLLWTCIAEDDECSDHAECCSGTCGVDGTCTLGMSPTPNPPTPKPTSPPQSPPTPPPSNIDWDVDGGLVMTHYWDCSGQSCDATTLSPWDPSKYRSSPGYQPQDPNNFGGSVYGEKMWLTAAIMNIDMGLSDSCCGDTDDGSGGCGQCVLVQNPDAINPDWTALIMKKNTCGSCVSGPHIDVNVPGFDVLQYSIANTCGEPGTGLSKEQSAVVGQWYNNYANTKQAQALCDELPPLYQEGCRLFTEWGWTTGNPQNARFKVVPCPQAFKDHIGSMFDASGVTAEGYP